MGSPDRLIEASGPRHGSEVRWDVRIPVRDGLELSANLWLPVPAPGAARDTGAGPSGTRSSWR